MTDTLLTGLLLLAVGMSTVLSVLALVVGTGKILILAVNSFLPATVGAVTTKEKSSGAKIAAIAAAVDLTTGGKGVITQIERLDE